jgi:hypothetical protein
MALRSIVMIQDSIQDNVSDNCKETILTLPILPMPSEKPSSATSFLSIDPFSFRALSFIAWEGGEKGLERREGRRGGEEVRWWDGEGEGRRGGEEVRRWGGMKVRNREGEKERRREEEKERRSEGEKERRREGEK